MCVVRSGEEIERVLGEGRFEENAPPNHARYLPGMHRIGNVRGGFGSTAVGAVKKNPTEDFEKKIRHPDNEVRIKLGSGRERFAENNEAVVNHHQHKRDGNPDARLPAMRLDREGNRNQGKGKAGK